MSASALFSALSFTRSVSLARRFAALAGFLLLRASAAMRSSFSRWERSA
jgi:hypothetical protein